MIDIVLGNPILAAMMLIAAGWAVAEARARPERTAALGINPVDITIPSGVLAREGRKGCAEGARIDKGALLAAS